MSADAIQDFRVGDHVIIDNDAGNKGEITKLLPGKAQINGKRWVRQSQLTLTFGSVFSDAAGGKPSHTALRDIWITNSAPVKFGLGNWRRYQDGYWPIVEKTEIEAEIMQVCEDAERRGVSVTDSLVNSVYKLAHRKCYDSDMLWDSVDDVLVLKNGTLDLSEMKLREHRMDDYVTRAIHYEYDQDAKCPIFEYAINSTVPDAMIFLQDFAGYCLTTETKYETALWLHGVPGSGKSTILHGFLTMLGDLVGLLGLAEIERSRFALDSLPGKRLVLSTEQPTSYMQASWLLNQIVSGEEIRVEEKFKPAYTIKPCAKVAWAMNSLPRVDGATNGIFRRVKVLEFPALAETEKDVTLKYRIGQEAPGILNWALAGLRRLRERGGFDIPHCMNNATEEFQRSNDKAALFVEECCVVGNEYRVQSSDLYSKYKDWCYENGYKPQSSHKMADEWRRLKFSRARINGRSHWQGVGLLSDVSL
jgi:putative DNA primase/helicase